jgi:protein-L-isoaspartate(D-aspartate) O-methyltransferase
MTDAEAALLREVWVEADIAPRGVDDDVLLDALVAVPRHWFAAPDAGKAAYTGEACAAADGDRLADAYAVAWMGQLAGVGPGRRVLELGSGSGYAAAVWAQTGAQVYAVDRRSEAIAGATRRWAALGLDIRARCADACAGWPEEAPFDAVLVGFALPELPAAWLSQLSPGGRIVLPLGPPGLQQLVVVRADGTHAAMGAVDFGAGVVTA